MPRAQDAQERRCTWMYGSKISSCIFDTCAVPGGRMPRAHDSMDGGGRATHDCMDAGGRTNHNYMDVGGRVTPGAVTEETESRRPKPRMRRSGDVHRVIISNV